MWGFVAAQCVVGTGLGASKVVFFLILIRVYGQRNFPLLVNATLTSFSLAGFLGPIFGWWGLSGHGKLGKDKNYGSELSNSVAVFNYCCAGVCFLGLLLSFGIRPIDFSNPKYKAAPSGPKANIHSLATFSTVRSSIHENNEQLEMEEQAGLIVGGSGGSEQSDSIGDIEKIGSFASSIAL